MNRGVGECSASKLATQNLVGKWGRFPSEQRAIRPDPETPEPPEDKQEQRKHEGNRHEAAHPGKVRPATRHRCTWAGAGCGVRSLRAGA